MVRYFLFFTVLTSLFSQGYIWPTNASSALTSSFAEPRANRFHAGIDITTWNREGYPCYAIADGYIYRIWTQPYGYGRALYVKLNDGRIAVYAHLQKFNLQIEAYIKSVQEESGKYNQNKYLKSNRFPVKQGDIIAYTGSTGIGSPHFHFEIRENMNTNSHTLSFYPNFKDATRPQPLHLYAKPLKKGSIVNRQVTFAELAYEQTSDSTYQIIDPIIVTGSVGLELEAIDRTLRYSIPTRPDYWEVYLNGEQIYSNHFTETTYTQNHFLNLDYSLFHKKMYNKKVKQLYVHPKTALNEFYSSKNYGILKNDSTRDKNATLEIRIRDFKENEIRIYGNVRFRLGQLIDFAAKPPIPNEYTDIAVAVGAYTISTDSLKNVTTTTAFSQKMWLPNQVNEFSDSLFTYSTQKNTLLDTVHVYSSKLNSAAFGLNKTDTNDIWLLQPVDMFFDRRLIVRTNRALQKGEGVYEWNRSNKTWDFIRTSKDDLGVASFKIRSVDIHTILVDLTPPIIQLKRRSKKDVLILIKDDRSGIRDETNYDVIWNGKHLVVEYDYEKHLLRIDPTDIRGKGTLTITCKDNVGNEAQRSFQL